MNGLTQQRNTKPLRWIAYIVAVFLVCGCTARQAYESLQQHARSECIGLPLSQQDDCLSQASLSFDEYQRLRHEAISSK